MNSQLELHRTVTTRSKISEAFQDAGGPEVPPDDVRAFFHLGHYIQVSAALRMDDGFPELQARQADF